MKIAEDLPEHLREPLAIIEEAASSGSRMISELMEYGRNVPARPEALNPELEIQKFLPVLQTAVGKEYTSNTKSPSSRSAKSSLIAINLIESC